MVGLIFTIQESYLFSHQQQSSKTGDNTRLGVYKRPLNSSNVMKS